MNHPQTDWREIMLTEQEWQDKIRKAELDEYRKAVRSTDTDEIIAFVEKKAKAAGCGDPYCIGYLASELSFRNAEVSA